MYCWQKLQYCNVNSFRNGTELVVLWFKVSWWLTLNKSSKSTIQYELLFPLLNKSLPKQKNKNIEQYLFIKQPSTKLFFKFFFFRNCLIQHRREINVMKMFYRFFFSRSYWNWNKSTVICCQIYTFFLSIIYLIDHSSWFHPITILNCFFMATEHN